MGVNSSKTVPVDWDELELAFDFASSGRAYENRAYIDVRTGWIYTVSDIGNNFEPVPADLEDADNYIAVPHKNDLDLGQRLVFAFVEQAMPDATDKLRSIFRNQGAYTRFKDLLEHRGLVNAWHDYENKATDAALRAWCRENGVEVMRA